MTAEIRDSLAQVQELLGRATFGILRADAHKDWFQPTVMLHSGENIIARYHHGYPDFTCTVGKSEYEWRNAEAIEACVNFVMQHGPELMKMLDRHGAGDAEAWRSIESAPRDGTEVLVAEYGDVVVARWSVGLRKWFGPRDSYGDPDIMLPTHWRPLPAPPTDDAARAGERG